MQRTTLRSCATKLAELRDRVQLTNGERAELDALIHEIENEIAKKSPCKKETYALVARIAFYELWRIVRDHLDQ